MFNSIPERKNDTQLTDVLKYKWNCNLRRLRVVLKKAKNAKSIPSFKAEEEILKSFKDRMKKCFEINPCLLSISLYYSEWKEYSRSRFLE